MTTKQDEFNERRFDVACRLADRAGVTTAMITGKGEPTLYPERLMTYAQLLSDRFPLVELQTNGIRLHDLDEVTMQVLAHNLTTVAISVTHWEDDKNQMIYTPGRKYPPLVDLIHNLHDRGLSIRLNCIMTKGLVDGLDNDVNGMIQFCRDNAVEQLTLMPVSMPSCHKTSRIREWVEYQQLPKGRIDALRERLECTGTILMTLAHGAVVFDIDGQNVCLSNCLQPQNINDKSLIRNLIYYPDGHLRYDWDHAGAILL